MNDFNLEGKVFNVAEDVQRIIDAQATTGLVLNRNEWEIVANSFDLVDQFQVFNNFKKVNKVDLTLLGASVLPGRAVDKILQEKISDLGRAINPLKDKIFVWLYNILN